MTTDKSVYLETFAALLEIKFNDLSYLQTALTHSSYMREKTAAGSENNQRMEFLGDAVLELVVSDYLYKLFPGYQEGELTKLRAAMVCETSLAKVARRFNLGYYLSMGKGEMLTGGRNRPSILADAFEAVIGSIYLDQGMEISREFIIRCLEPILQDIISGDYERDFKTELQERIQHLIAEKVTYEILKEEGPDHNKRFTAGVVLQGKVVSEGRGRSKKEAEQHAAKNYLQQIKERQVSEQSKQ